MKLLKKLNFLTVLLLSSSLSWVQGAEIGEKTLLDLEASADRYFRSQNYIMAKKAYKKLLKQPGITPDDGEKWQKKLVSCYGPMCREYNGQYALETEPEKKANLCVKILICYQK